MKAVRRLQRATLHFDTDPVTVRCEVLAVVQNDDGSEFARQMDYPVLEDSKLQPSSGNWGNDEIVAGLRAWYKDDTLTLGEPEKPRIVETAGT